MDNQKLRSVDYNTFKRAERYIETANNFARRSTSLLEDDYRLLAYKEDGTEVCVAEFIDSENIAGYTTDPIYKVHESVLKVVQHHIIDI